MAATVENLSRHVTARPWQFVATLFVIQSQIRTRLTPFDSMRLNAPPTNAVPSE